MSAYNSGLSQGATPEQAAHAATCRPQVASTVHIPKCPTCGSTDLTKITTGTKVANGEKTSEQLRQEVIHKYAQ